MKNKIIQLPGLFNKQYKAKKDNEKVETVRGETDEDHIYSDMLLMPVRYASETRHSKYYVNFSNKELYYGYDLSQYIRVDRTNIIDKSKWVYPYEGQVVSSFTMSQLEAHHKKYVYLKRSYSEMPLLHFKKENIENNFLFNIIDLPYFMIINARLDPQLPLSYTEPNKYGLLLCEDVKPTGSADEILLLRESYIEQLHNDTIFMAVHLSEEKKDEKRYLKTVKLANDTGHSSQFKLVGGKMDAEVTKIFTLLTDDEIAQCKKKKIF